MMDGGWVAFLIWILHQPRWLNRSRRAPIVRLLEGLELMGMDHPRVILRQRVSCKKVEATMASTTQPSIRKKPAR